MAMYHGNDLSQQKLLKQQTEEEFDQLRDPENGNRTIIMYTGSHIYLCSIINRTINKTRSYGEVLKITCKHELNK